VHAVLMKATINGLPVIDFASTGSAFWL